MIFKITPKPTQHWSVNEREYRILTVTRGEPLPRIVEQNGFSMEVQVWGNGDVRRLYREIALAGQKPKPWAGRRFRKSALTWMSGAKEPWVVFYRMDEGTVYWGLPRDVFAQQFKHVDYEKRN